ncbi:hypothetical protein LK542_23000 [Massilia sp. IC2-477]|uniref:hypothetical protein n=1 Tax=Massilia sp. IC2-477 TaxID=2887198 RepID=UPI001D11033D|nr:hypothetical protein [Massilia sp. IC2-477]MCC2958484.1 hypothetical protein [Massilia sp. IC2-477]
MKPIPTETGTDMGNVGKWLGAAAAGALLMYLLDPERGSARRSRAYSALRTAGSRTGASVDHALHSAGDRLADLKDSAAGALARGAGRLQTQAAPVIERARHGAQDAARRFENSAERLKDRAQERNSYERYDSYASDRDDGNPRGALGQWLRSLSGRKSEVHTGYQERADGPHPALVGGGMLGLLSLMRRSPGGLLVGLAGLALLWQNSRPKTYRVSDNMAPMRAHPDEHGQAPMIPQGEQAGSRYLH